MRKISDLVEGFSSILMICLGFSLIGRGQTQDVSGCKVSLTVREFGKIQKSNGDTLVDLSGDTTMSLAVNIANLGKATKFDVRLEPTGFEITDGSLSRKGTAEVDKMGMIHFSIRSKNSKIACKNSALSLGVVVSPENEPGTICGQTVRHFFCPHKKKIDGK